MQNNTHVTIRQFSLAESQYNIQYIKKKLVAVLHDNEGGKPRLMGPDLYFKINSCQNRVQRNKQQCDILVQC